jgi:hypothetical protein|tara:strand:- start:668 stop:1048 length:381 start_codon:yes stop_codon:yes gene_type:complete
MTQDKINRAWQVFVPQILQEYPPGARAYGALASDAICVALEKLNFNPTLTEGKAPVPWLIARTAKFAQYMKDVPPKYIIFAHRWFEREGYLDPEEVWQRMADRDDSHSNGARYRKGGGEYDNITPD